MMADAIRATDGHARRGGRMTRMVSIIMPSSELDDHAGSSAVRRRHRGMGVGLMPQFIRSGG
jgi:hypothetical protein